MVVGAADPGLAMGRFMLACMLAWPAELAACMFAAESIGRIKLLLLAGPKLVLLLAMKPVR